MDGLSITVINSVDEGGIDVVPLLLRPSLHSIEFLGEEPTPDSPITSTLRTISKTKKLSLKEMEFHFFWDVSPLIGMIAQAIASQTSLRRLTLNGYSGIALLAGSATDLFGGVGDIDAFAFSKNALELFDVMASTFSEGDKERVADMFRCWWPKARFCRSDGGSRATVHWDIDEALRWPGPAESKTQFEAPVN
ncbi:hypothetical protein M407DRAFT_24277 [Tulasnella calospora MUT 4182]|uniref:Uncharacterized protein n=1 Tax=Tulasnella calospora MUT 4182 TaxID=1051891 RepID=A0A0C3Q1K1_9AGAM|nr:hypothetical protein M407DRAFT_34277 [Tulasnella calospora MUT 4182]KIO26427.1 hypothetical protein M407DRAFT_24277 [Tulasnella calospora MUT 4182]